MADTPGYPNRWQARPGTLENSSGYAVEPAAPLPGRPIQTSSRDSEQRGVAAGRAGWLTAAEAAVPPSTVLQLTARTTLARRMVRIDSGMDSLFAGAARRPFTC